MTGYIPMSSFMTLALASMTGVTFRPPGAPVPTAPGMTTTTFSSLQSPTVNVIQGTFPTPPATVIPATSYETY